MLNNFVHSILILEVSGLLGQFIVFQAKLEFAALIKLGRCRVHWVVNEDWRAADRFLFLGKLVKLEDLVTFGENIFNLAVYHSGENESPEFLVFAEMSGSCKKSHIVNKFIGAKAAQSKQTRFDHLASKRISN